MSNAANPVDAAKMAADFQRRIQQAIFRISEKVQTGDRARLDAYIRHVHPSMRSQGDANFPASLRRMPYNSDRTVEMIYPGILHFHVGNAIATYYEVLNGEPKLSELERRTALLEQIATCGPRAFVVIGSEGNGFTMIHRDEKPVKFINVENAAKQADPDET